MLTIDNMDDAAQFIELGNELDQYRICVNEFCSESTVAEDKDLWKQSENGIRLHFRTASIQVTGDNNMRYTLFLIFLAGCADERAFEEAVTTNIIAQESDQTTTTSKTVDTRTVAATVTRPQNQPRKFEAGISFDATVVTVTAGDELTVHSKAFGQKKLFLYGIAAPRKGQPGFDASRRYLERTVKGQTVHVYLHSFRANRDTAAHVSVDSEAIYGKDPNGVNLPPLNLNRYMVRWGMAWHDTREAKGDRSFGDYQQTAVRKRRGLWSDGVPVPPWEWKKPQTDDDGQNLPAEKSD